VGGSKTKQTSNQQQSSTVQLPAWMTEAGQGLYQDAKRTADANPIQGYNGELAPGMSGNQTMASQAARSSYGTGQRDLNAARMLTMRARRAAPDGRCATAGSRYAGDAPMMRAAQQGAAATMRPAFQTLAPSVAADQVGSANFTPDAAAQYMSPYQSRFRTRRWARCAGRATLTARPFRIRSRAQARGAAPGRRSRKASWAAISSSCATTTSPARTKPRSTMPRTASSRIARRGCRPIWRTRARTFKPTPPRQAFSISCLGAIRLPRTTPASSTRPQTNAQRAADATLRQQAGQSNQDVRSRFQLSDQAAENQARGANADRQFDANKTNASLYQSMLDRLLQGGSQMAGYGGQANDMAGADIGRLALTGQTEQDTSGKQDAAKYNEFLRMQDAPMDRYRDLMAILSGTPRNVSTNGTSSGTSVTQQSGGLLNQLLAAGQIAASAFSDRRLKRDVTRLATSTSGLGLYAYRYLWDDEPRIGVMADEVERIAPEALGPVVAGFKTVNYSALEGAL
jgi:hypothetical protein